jgi:hypothetical protein
VFVTLKSTEDPTPLNATDEGLPAALWATDKAADLAPTDEGVNVTVTVCEAPALTVNDVGLTVNIDASVPETVMPVMERLALPVLLTVNVFCDVAPTPVLSIARDAADRLTAGAGGGGCAVPLPVRVREDGLPAALWATDSVADFVPAEVGANVTVTVWGDPPALIVKLAGLTLNCAPSVPPTVTDEAVSPAAPVLDTVKVNDLVCPTCTSPKLREAVETDRAGAVAT